MSRDDVELVRRSVETFIAGNVEGAIEEFFDPEGEFISRFGALDGRSYKGPDGARQYFADIADAWETYERELVEVVDAGEAVVAVLNIRAVARASRVPVERRIGLAYWVRGERIVRMVSYPSVNEALEAVRGNPS